MFDFDIAKLKRQLSDVKPPLATAASLPPACYSRPEILELEKQLIFKRSWLSMGRADQWQDKGNYSIHEIPGTSIIILRDQNLQLRAYANSCRHRGAKLLDGSGRCDVIRCPFHRWTYALDGRLLLAPNMEDGKSIDYQQYGLIELSVEQRLGFVFVSPGQPKLSIDQWLGDFADLHRPWQLADMVSYRRHQFQVNCNWKAFLDVFNEYYHLPYVHPDSINSVYLQPDQADEVSGQYASQFGATEGTGALLEDAQQFSLPRIDSLDQRLASGARYSWVFPNMAFAAGAESLWIYEALPVNSQCSNIVLSLCFPKATTQVPSFETNAEHYFNRLLAAINEDIPALENQQQGLNSCLARPGRFCEALEPNVANFACWYARQMQLSPVSIT